MRDRQSQSELCQLIVSLFSHIAQINRLPSESRNTLNTVVFEDKKGQALSYNIVSSYTDGPGSWVVVDRDKPLWDEAVFKLQNLNRNTVSRRSVEQMLANLGYKYQTRAWKLSGIPQDVNRLITDIKSVEGAAMQVRFPIWGLMLNAPLLTVGNVEFEPIWKHSDIDIELKKLSPEQDTQLFRIHAIAIAEGKGDSDMIRENAETKANQALNILRAFTYEMVPDSGLKQMGIMGSYYALTRLHFTEEVKSASPNLRDALPSFQRSGLVNIAIDQYRIQRFEEYGFNRLSEALRSSTATEIEKGLIRGAEWIGEATKPDTPHSKFLKVAFAIDAMIGDDASDIPDKGITARIAERSAFLLASRMRTRQQVYDNMRDFFNKRGKLAHGSTIEVTEEEIERFGGYARAILIQLLKWNPPFRKVKDLATWVQRKSLKG